MDYKVLLKKYMDVASQQHNEVFVGGWPFTEEEAIELRRIAAELGQDIECVETNA